VAPFALRHNTNKPQRTLRITKTIAFVDMTLHVWPVFGGEK
jgi:hypothetical protein